MVALRTAGVGVLFGALLFASPAMGWPVDWIHDVEPGKEKFVKLPRLDWFEVDDPNVVNVEWLADSNELLLTAVKPGRAVVLLGADGKVAAWRVRVGGAPAVDEQAFVLARKRCPDLKPTPLEDIKLTVTVNDDPCRKALLTLFQSDAFEARHLDLTFEGKVLQAQLISLQEGLQQLTRGRVKARYVGAGLILEGQVSVGEHRKVLWEVLKRSLGRFALDDQLEEPAADAGVP